MRGSDDEQRKNDDASLYAVSKLGWTKYFHEHIDREQLEDLRHIHHEVRIKIIYAHYHANKNQIIPSFD